MTPRDEYPRVLKWRKSTRSDSGPGQCVEASLSREVHVRDSKLDTSGDFPFLSMSVAEWAAALDAIKHDRFPA